MTAKPLDVSNFTHLAAPLRIRIWADLSVESFPGFGDASRRVSAGNFGSEIALAERLRSSEDLRAEDRVERFLR